MGVIVQGLNRNRGRSRVDECNDDVTAVGAKDRRIYSCEMESGEKFIRRILKLVFMILAFVIAILFDEFSFRMGWLGVVIFILGASMGALALYLLKDLRN
jgi:hypothetical protein